MTRRLFFGEGAYDMIMQAGYNRASRAYGYNSDTTIYGSLTPNIIKYQGVSYTINVFHSVYDTIMAFANNKMPPISTIVLNINGTRYTLTKDNKFKNFSTSATAFTSQKTYKIKIISMQ